MLRVGFEGSDEDEKWLCYFADTDELDLTSWRAELEGRADRAVRTDPVVPTTDGLGRRLRLVGAAMRARPKG